MIQKDLDPSQVEHTMRVTRDRIRSTESWPEWAMAKANDFVPTIQCLMGGDHILVTGIGGQVRAKSGDFIVKLNRGSLAVCTAFMAEDGKQYMRVRS